MTEAEQAQFLNRGRDFVTEFAQLMERFNAYASVFEARGGAAALGDYGDDTVQIIFLRNDLDALLAANNGHHRAIMARLRSDY